MMIVSFPPPAKPLNMNDRYHWAAKAKLTQAWRHATHIAARDAINRGEFARNQPFSIVQLSLPVRSLNVRRDPGNWSPTTKACLDGLVDASVFPDDDQHHVAELPPRFHALRDDPAVSVLIRPATPGDIL